MGKKNVARMALILIAVLLLTSACGTKASSGDAVQDLEPTPTLVAVGSTMDKPVPFSYDIILPDLVISVSEVNRPADAFVSSSSAETPTPQNGQEYLLVRISNQCVKPGLDKCFVGFSDYQLIDSAGNMLLPESSVSGQDGFFAFKEFSSGTSNKGYLAFMVEEDGEYPFLTYQTFQGTSVYLSLAN